MAGQQRLQLDRAPVVFAKDGLERELKSLGLSSMVNTWAGSKLNIIKAYLGSRLLIG